MKVDVDGLEHQLCERKATAEIQEAEKEILTKQLKDAQEKISICEIQVNSYETENSLLGSQLAELTSDNSKVCFIHLFRVSL